MTPSRACEFCGQSGVKITNEHAWPNWLCALFKPIPTTVIGTFPDNRPAVHFSPALNDMGVKANAFCRVTCNAGWMNDLERSVQPILSPMIKSGESTRLSTSDAEIVATWVAKTAMVFEFTGGRKPFYTFEDRDSLRTTSRPLVPVMVWLARYSGSSISTAFARGVEYDLEIDDRLNGRATANCATITVGQLAVQIFAGRSSEPTGVWLPYGAKWDPFVVPIWPPLDDAAHWPPPAAIDDTRLDDFVNRFFPVRQSGGVGSNPR